MKECLVSRGSKTTLLYKQLIKQVLRAEKESAFRLIQLFNLPKGAKDSLRRLYLISRNPASVWPSISRAIERDQIAQAERLARLYYKGRTDNICSI